MNVVLDAAAEVSLKGKSDRKELGQCSSSLSPSLLLRLALRLISSLELLADLLHALLVYGDRSDPP